MAKLRVLHLLYSGSENGGAQRVAIECAIHNSDLYTSTVKSGGLQKILRNKSLKSIKFYELIFSHRFDIIFCSDPRALLFSFFSLRSIFSKKYLILHSDRMVKYKLLITSFCRLLRVHFLCTTKTQINTFKTPNVCANLVRICDIPKMKAPNSKTKNFLYFGRFDKVKNIQEIIDICADARKINGELKLILVGSGDHSFTNTYGVEVIDHWKSQAQLREIMKNCSFIVNATNYEGFSLQIMEGLSNGLFPLVKAKGLIRNYDLPEECILNIENVIKAINMDELDWSQFIVNFQKSLIVYLQDTEHLKDFIRARSC